MYSRTTQNDVFGVFVSGRGLRLMIGANHQDKVFVVIPLSQCLSLQKNLSSGQEIVIPGGMTVDRQFVSFEVRINQTGCSYADSLQRTCVVQWVENELEVLQKILDNIVQLVGFASIVEQTQWVFENYLRRSQQPQQTQISKPQSPQVPQVPTVQPQTQTQPQPSSTTQSAPPNPTQSQLNNNQPKQSIQDDDIPF